MFVDPITYDPGQQLGPTDDTITFSVKVMQTPFRVETIIWRVIGRSMGLITDATRSYNDSTGFIPVGGKVFQQAFHRTPAVVFDDTNDVTVVVEDAIRCVADTLRGVFYAR
jgi:hypothetical protein